MERARCCSCPANVLLPRGYCGQPQWQTWEHHSKVLLLARRGQQWTQVWWHVMGGHMMWALQRQDLLFLSHCIALRLAVWLIPVGTSVPAQGSSC